MEIRTFAYPDLVAPDLVAPDLVALHLGALHPAEQALVYALAFGPFAVLALVVVLRRRQDRLGEQPPAPAPGEPGRQRER